MKTNKNLFLSILALTVNYGLYGMDGDRWNQENTRLWDNSAREMQIFSNHASSIQSIAISADGQYMVMGNGDHTVNIWDVNTNTGHTIGVDFIQAAKDGDIPYFNKHIDSNRYEIDNRDPSDMTPLMWCVLNNHIEFAKLLIAKLADLDLQDDCGYTALHWAAYQGKLEFVKLLLEAGANKKLICTVGLKGTAEQLAQSQRRIATAKMLRDYKKEDKEEKSK